MKTGKRLGFALLLISLLLGMTACDSRADRQARKAEQEEFYTVREAFLQDNTIAEKIEADYSDYVTSMQEYYGEDSIVEQVEVEIQWAGVSPDGKTTAKKPTGYLYDKYILHLIVSGTIDEWPDGDHYDYLAEVRIGFEDYMDQLLHEQYPEYAEYLYDKQRVKDIFGDKLSLGKSEKIYVETSENIYEDASRSAGGNYYRNGESVHVYDKGSHYYHLGDTVGSSQSSDSCPDDKTESDSNTGGSTRSGAGTGGSTGHLSGNGWRMGNGSGSQSGTSQGSSSSGASTPAKDPYDADIDGYYEDNRDIYDDWEDAYDDWEDEMDEWDWD